MLGSRLAPPQCLVGLITFDTDSTPAERDGSCSHATQPAAIAWVRRPINVEAGFAAAILQARSKPASYMKAFPASSRPDPSMYNQHRVCRVDSCAAVVTSCVASQSEIAAVRASSSAVQVKGNSSVASSPVLPCPRHSPHLVSNLYLCKTKRFHANDGRRQGAAV